MPRRMDINDEFDNYDPHHCSDCGIAWNDLTFIQVKNHTCDEGLARMIEQIERGVYVPRLN